MRRGSIVVAADRGGEFTGKPRPALVISSDALDTATVAVLPITSRGSDETPLRVSAGFPRPPERG